MLIVTSPLLHRVLVDRTADLFGAGGANRTLRLMELEAGRFELQSAIFKQRADLGFRVLDHPLVDDAVDPARKDGIDVGHQADIVGVIMPEVLEVVGEILPPSEMLAKV